MAKAAKKPAKPTAKKTEKVKLLTSYTKDKSFSTTFLIFMLLLICAGLVGTMYYYWSTKPEPVYFARTNDGKIFEMEPLNRPYLNEKQLYQWAAEASVASYTFDFVNYQRDIEAAQEYYTPNGYRQLVKALRDSNTLSDVRTKKLVSSAVATGAPIILSQGIRNERYFWKLQMPMKVTYQSANEVIPQDLIVTLIVSRVPVEEKPKGIGIESILVRQGRIQP